jgi:tetratricopeptide (TPR) repeat protein
MEAESCIRGILAQTVTSVILAEPRKLQKNIAPTSGALPNDDPPLEILTLLKVATDEWNRRTGASLLRGLQLFRRVVDVDPECVDGHLGVAACVTMGCHIGFAVLPKTELSNARRAADKALSLSKKNHHKAAALCQKAQIRMMYDWDFEEAERLLNEALLLDDTCAPVYHFLSHLYLITNRWHAVMDAITAARRIAPSSPMLHSTAGLLLHFMRHRSEATEVGEAVVSLHPEFGRGHIMLGFAYEADGQYDRAVAAFRTGLDMETHVTPLAALGHAYAAAGMRRKASAVLNELSALSRTQFVSQYFFALVHAGLGDGDEALNCLGHAFREGCDWLLHAGVEPRWDNLRHTERFQRLLMKLRLPDLAV